MSRTIYVHEILRTLDALSKEQWKNYADCIDLFNADSDRNISELRHRMSEIERRYDMYLHTANACDYVGILKQDESVTVMKAELDVRIRYLYEDMGRVPQGTDLLEQITTILDTRREINKLEITRGLLSVTLSVTRKETNNATHEE